MIRQTFTSLGLTPSIEVEITVAAPTPEPTGEFRCNYSIAELSGAGARDECHAYGASSMQAFLLALGLAAADVLSRFKSRGGRANREEWAGLERVFLNQKTLDDYC
jgi:hypothetical protein